MSLCVHKADLTKHSKQERERKESTNVDLKKKTLEQVQGNTILLSYYFGKHSVNCCWSGQTGHTIIKYNKDGFLGCVVNIDM